MKKITNLIIIDASGSMTSKAEEIRGGLRLLFKEIKSDAALGEAKIRTIVTQFSSPGHFKELVNTKKAEKLTNELADAYQPMGMTALFDAIGQGFGLVDEKQDSVFVTIMTDGMENSSQEYDQETVTKLISGKRGKGWTIAFMGTTEQAVKQAQSWGVSVGNSITVTNNAEGFYQAGRRLSKMRGQHHNVSVGRIKKNLDDLGKDSE